MNVGELTERCGDLPETLVPARSFREVPEGRSCNEVPEYVENFLIIDFLQNSYQTESCFFPRLGLGISLAI